MAAILQPEHSVRKQQYIVRLDFQATASQRIYGRYLHDEYNLIEPFGTFSGAPLPTVPTPHHEHPAQAPNGHGWAMWLMCVPMLLIAGVLLTLVTLAGALHVLMARQRDATGLMAFDRTIHTTIRPGTTRGHVRGLRRSLQKAVV